MKTPLQARIDAMAVQEPRPNSASVSATAFDVYPKSPYLRVADRGPSRQVRQMAIREALEWAFGTELASVDFDEYLRPSVGIEFVLMKQATLGEQIDCSPGRSLPASDAEIIASIVRSVLSFSEAVRIAELAAAGRVPDWMPGAKAKLEPIDWVFGSKGARGKTVDVAIARNRAEMRISADMAWPATYRRSRKTGAMQRQANPFVPCRWAPSPRKIAQARRAYLKWIGDLQKIFSALKPVDLQWVELVEGMPPVAPWRDQDGDRLTEYLKGD